MKRSILFGVVASAVIGLNLWACSDDDVSTGIANEISSSSEDAANDGGVHRSGGYYRGSADSC